MLSLWLGYMFFCNTLLATHFWISMGRKELLLSEYSETGISENNDEHIWTENGPQSNEVHYQISPRSRCTQLCIFLILESRQGNAKKTADGQNVKNNEHTIASTILFKWQTTESHYRALACAIAQNTKRAV
ncbi:MAG: hypothetical protein ACI9DQ_000041 [Glaciecola sp.]|jgi:hypothetical protein